MNLTEALRTADTAQTPAGRAMTKTEIAQHFDQLIAGCERLGYQDLASELLGAKMRFLKRRRNATRH